MTYICALKLEKVHNKNTVNTIGLSQWYVVRTAANAEFKVAQRLSDQGFSVFLPTYHTIRMWSDRKKKVTLPLISSTLFIRCTPADLKRIYQIQGVAGILSYLGKPAQVKNWEIANLQIVMNEMNGSHGEQEQCNFEMGETVRVVRGPFKGLLGTSVECDGKHRVQITIDCIGAAFTVNVPKSFVKKENEQLVA